MIKIILDTCVVIDFLQNREPFSKEAKAIFYLLADNKINACITANTVTDIYYLMHKATHDSDKTNELIQKLLDFVDVIDVNKDDITNALCGNIKDFEDAVLNFSAKRNHFDIIVTRNTKDFANSTLTIKSPTEFLTSINFLL